MPAAGASSRPGAGAPQGPAVQGSLFGRNRTEAVKYVADLSAKGLGPRTVSRRTIEAGSPARPVGATAGRLVLGAMLLLWSTHAYAQNGPNIFVIMVDDMAQHMLNACR